MIFIRCFRKLISSTISFSSTSYSDPVSSWFSFFRMFSILFRTCTIFTSSDKFRTYVSSYSFATGTYS